MRASVHRFGMRDPSDVSELAAAVRAGAVDPARIVAVLGKTEGNGLVNDYTRGYFAQSLKLLLGPNGERPLYIFSGGTEGVLSPHYVVFCVDDGRAGNTRGKALAVGCAVSRELKLEEIGTRAHALLVADAVREAMAAAKLEREDVRFVQVKCPASAAARDPNKLMAYSRVAGAFGVGVALGEIDAGFSESAFFADLSLYSPRASVSSGVEIRLNEVMVLGNSAAWGGPLSIASRPMADALDLDALLCVL